METFDVLGKERRTNWKAVGVAGIVNCLASVESTFSLLADWPYMNKVDPDATSNFYGVSSSFSKVGHLIGLLVFSIWTFKTHTVRKQILVSRLLALAACCLYLSVEYLPDHRRYQLLICNFLFWTARSSFACLRSYMVLFSSEEDRAKAFSIFTAAGIFAQLLAPLGQYAFSGIDYPGITVFGEIRVNLFTAPIWLATLANIICVLCVVIVMDEMPPKTQKELTGERSGLSFASLRSRWNELILMDVPWFFAIFCLLMRIILMVPTGTLDVIFQPLVMTVYGWSSADTVIRISYIIGITGILGFATCSLYAATRLGKWIPTRSAFLLALVLYVITYLSSYPWSAISHPLAEYNATTGGGCNPVEYSWCSTAKASSSHIFIIVNLAASSIGLMMGIVALDTIYSKVLRSVDQSIMQAVVICIDDIGLIVEPIITTRLFTEYGQPAVWWFNGSIAVIGILLWILFYKKLRPYQ